MTSLLSGPTRPARTASEAPTDVAHRRPLVLLALLGGVAAAAGPLVVCLGGRGRGLVPQRRGRPRGAARRAAGRGVRLADGPRLRPHGRRRHHLGDPAGHHRDLRLGGVADRTPGGRLGLRPRTRRRRDRRRRPRLDRACRDGPVHGGVRRRCRRDAPRAVRRLRAACPAPAWSCGPCSCAWSWAVPRSRSAPAGPRSGPRSCRSPCGPPRRSASRSSPRSCSCRRRCSWSRSRSTSAPPST